VEEHAEAALQRRERFSSRYAKYIFCADGYINAMPVGCEGSYTGC
jgi:hypothetical protein